MGGNTGFESVTSIVRKSADFGHSFRNEHKNQSALDSKSSSPKESVDSNRIHLTICLRPA